MKVHEKTSTRELDPRARIFAVILLIIGLMVLPWGVSLWTVTVVASVALFALKVPVKRLSAAVATLSWMLVITVAVHGFTAPGHVLWEVPLVEWKLTLEGLAQGGLFAGRLAAVVILGAGLSLSMSALEGVRALEALGRPFAVIGLPVATLTMVLALSLRFVPTLFEEAMLLRKALQARGWTPGHGLVNRIRAWIPLFVPVLASGLRRSDEIAETLVLRGYAPGVRRTSMFEGHWGWRETLVVMLAILPWLMLLFEVLP
jgi:energy-coupling factor transport system permease protein